MSELTGFDAVIVGSGFGGAAAAYELTRAGIKTLMLERGNWAKRDADDWNPEKILIKSRYFGPDPMDVKQYDASEFKRTPYNEVVGGMSVFYGGASFRLRERDFEKWPLSYKDFEAYFGQAEQLLGIHGEAGVDPCEPPRSTPFPFSPIPLNPPAQRIFNAARSLGLKPSAIPMSLNHKDKLKPVCLQCQTCDGYPCKVNAKGEAASRILANLNPQFFKLITDAQISKFVEDNGRIKSVEFFDRRTRQRHSVSSRLFVLSAGALWSPGILQRSFSSRTDKAFWHVGKFLMRHCNGIQSFVFPFKTNPGGHFHKQLAILDFYEDLRAELGTAVGAIQDIYTPSQNVVEHFAPSGLKAIAGAFSNYIQSLLCVAEDDPQEENQVRLSKDRDGFGLERLEVIHSYTENDYRRRDHLLHQAKRVLRKAGGLIPRLMKIDSFSHAVGTVRFGNDPRASALDIHCGLHGIPNLFVLDGSFMPTSAGVNPSLTIVANSLRVGQYLANQGRERWA